MNHCVCYSSPEIHPMSSFIFSILFPELHLISYFVKQNLAPFFPQFNWPLLQRPILSWNKLSYQVSGTSMRPNKSFYQRQEFSAANFMKDSKIILSENYKILTLCFNWELIKRFNRPCCWRPIWNIKEWKDILRFFKVTTFLDLSIKSRGKQGNIREISLGYNYRDAKACQSFQYIGANFAPLVLVFGQRCRQKLVPLCPISQCAESTLPIVLFFKHHATRTGQCVMLFNFLAEHLFQGH